MPWAWLTLHKGSRTVKGTIREPLQITVADLPFTETCNLQLLFIIVQYTHNYSKISKLGNMQAHASQGTTPLHTDRLTLHTTLKLTEGGVLPKLAIPRDPGLTLEAELERRSEGVGERRPSSIERGSSVS